MLEVFGFHLSVTYCYTSVGDVFLYGILQTLEVAYSVIHDIYLTVATHLEVHGIYDYLRTECVYLRLYWVAVGRRSLYYTQVARSHQ